jgi:hypothetical protein
MALVPPFLPIWFEARAVSPVVIGLLGIAFAVIGIQRREKAGRIALAIEIGITTLGALWLWSGSYEGRTSEHSNPPASARSVGIACEPASDLESLICPGCGEQRCGAHYPSRPAALPRAWGRSSPPTSTDPSCAAHLPGGSASRSR